MHKNLDINLKNISKIEGHTHLDVKIRNKKVKHVKLKIKEGKRYFSTAIQNKPFEQVPNIVSRICGTCSSAHTIGSISAIEKALDFKASKQTMILRKILMYASHLRDHAMHLYFFTLPDIFNKESVFDFNKKQHKYLHDGLKIKSVGNELCTLIGGRAVHPPNVLVGGFSKIPKNTGQIIKKLKKIRPKIIELIRLLEKNSCSFARKTNYAALVNKDYDFIDGKIKTTYGSVIEEKDYKKHLQRVIIPYSSATAFEFESKEFMVGALARMNLNRHNLHKETKKEANLKLFPSNCVFSNNLAQAIEMLHETDSCIDLLNNNFKQERIPKIKPKNNIGTDGIEAPRGTLYYQIKINDKGLIKNVQLVIPTQQNIIHLEKDLKDYIQTLLNKPKKTISYEAEKMIRAYDPCMSCATHFLKINWI